MSYDFDDDDNEQQSGGALRAQLEKALKDLKAVQDENAKLSASVKSATLETVLRDKGIPPKIQRWLKRDDVEPTADAVDKWLAENGEDFGWKPRSSAETPEGEQSKPEEAPAAQSTPSVLTDEDAAAYQRANQLAAQGVGQTLTSDQQKAAVDAVASQLDGNPDFGDVVRLLEAQGISIESTLKH